MAQALPTALKAAAGVFRKLLGLLLLAMVLLNVANAAGRYIFGKAIPGSDEILVFAMVWLVFLGAVLVAAQGSHLGFDLLSRSLKSRAGRLLDAGRLLGVAVLTAFVALQSWQVLAKLARIGQSSMATGIPMTVPHSAVFLGLAAIALISFWAGLRQLARAARGEEAAP